jgi:murein DD-endopeptidase MepM/ murein hydrolase activator NlpD
MPRAAPRPPRRPADPAPAAPRSTARDVWRSRGRGGEVGWISWIRCIIAALAAAALAAPAAHAARADVAALQVALRAKGLYTGTIDGVRGPMTSDAVRRLQARRGLVIDGIPGPATRKALGRRGKPPLGSRTLRAGARGWDVAGLQFLLSRSGFPAGPVDGGLGPRTELALERFQRWAGLTPDRLAGPATIARLRGPAPTSPLIFAPPVIAPVGDRFGPRGDGFHPGIDYPVRSGTRIRAAGRGCVTFAGWDSGGYGNLVVIGHRLGMTSWYAHLSKVGADPGDCVVAGTPIGRAGSTGRSTGPHLHFELRLRGAAVPPRF